MSEKDRRRTARLVRGLYRAAKRMRGYLETRYGPALASELTAGARQEYARLIPKLPNLHGRQPFTQFVITTGWSLAFYRALAQDGNCFGLQLSPKNGWHHAMLTVPSLRILCSDQLTMSHLRRRRQDEVEVNSTTKNIAPTVWEVALELGVNHLYDSSTCEKLRVRQ